MKLPRPYTLQEVATLLNAQFIGSPELAVTGINEIHVVETGDIAFVDHPKYYEKTLASSASVILINKEVECPPNKGLIILEKPFEAFIELTKKFKPFSAASKSINDSAIIGEGTVIQPNVFVGNQVTIGKNCLIHPGVVLYDGVTIGDHVIIHANTTIGSDAFYYQRKPDGHRKFYTSGTVIIEDNVEIGAACTIDAGSTGETVIGEGTKIDNQVHIGHDTKIGKRCIIAAQVGISGCTTLRDDVTIWGQVGITANVTIHEKAEVYAQSGVMKNVEAGTKIFGSPAKEARQQMREIAILSKLSSKR